jgi:hypothetical protein
LRHEGKRNVKNRHPDAKRRRAMADELYQKQGIADEGGDLEVPWGLLLGIYQTGIPAT